MSMTVEPYILLVGIGAGDLPVSDGVRGEFSGFSRRCPDVFRALARIGRDFSIRAVVVDIGSVASGQSEFFTLVGRVRPELPVYVVATAAPLADKCDEAIELGASGRLTDELASSLCVLCRVTQEPGMNETHEAVDSMPVKADEVPRVQDVTPVEPSVEPPVVHQVDVTEVVGVENDSQPVVAEELAVEDDDVEGLPIEGEESDSESARVPWLRYTEVPGRKAPGGPMRGQPKRESPTSDRLSSAETNEHEPLLTNEELAALLGDDDLGVSPDETGSDTGHEDGGAIR